MDKKFALLFPGQGSQIVGMGADFFQTFKESALVFEEASDVTHLNLKKICFDGPIELLTKTSNLQPALFTVECAIFSALNHRVDLKPLFAAGHSLGEYAALYSTGSLKVSDGATLTAIRGKAMQEAADVMFAEAKKEENENSSVTFLSPMCAVLGVENQIVEKLCVKTKELTKLPISPANYNAPGQVVIAGHPRAIEKACALAKTDPEFGGAKTIPLQVSAPFHCEIMKPAELVLSDALEKVHFTQPRFPILSNVTANAVHESTDFSDLLTSQVTSAVRWEQSMRTGVTMGVEIVLELGPGKVLAGLQKRIDKNIQTFNIASVEQFDKILKEVFHA